MAVMKRGKRKKGQMFIIGVIFIIVMAVLIKNMVATHDISQENEFQSRRMLDRSLDNMQREFGKFISVAAASPDANSSGIYMNDFASFLRRDAGAKIFYAYIVTNSSSLEYAATFGNYLGDTMNLSYNATNSTPAWNILMRDKSSASVQGTFISGRDINISINYTIGGRQTSENFIIRAAGDDLALFYDLMLEDEGIFVRSKKICAWPEK